VKSFYLYFALKNGQIMVFIESGEPDLPTGHVFDREHNMQVGLWDFYKEILLKEPETRLQRHLIANLYEIKVFLRFGRICHVVNFYDTYQEKRAT
jgi:hypothetical protein